MNSKNDAGGNSGSPPCYAALQVEPTPQEISELVAQCNAIPELGMIARRLSFHFESVKSRLAAMPFDRERPECPGCGAEFESEWDCEFTIHHCDCGCTFEAKRYIVSRSLERRE